ncbi:MAG: LPS export ABC transporter permease LptG [Pseudomonadales bacterium]|nr:LPS export ABC transporter permease LptG [Pseudomonadales bacterium]
MKSILARYVSRVVFKAVLITILVIIGFSFIAEVIDELNDIQQGYAFLDVLIHAVLHVPTQTFEFLPSAVLIGCLSGLGLLAKNSELTVMRASGISTQKIFWYVIKPILLVMLMALLLIEYIAPSSLQLADQRKAQLQSGEPVSISAESVWALGQNEMIYIRRVEATGALSDVLLFRYDDEKKLTAYLHAREGHFIDGDGDLEYLYNELDHSGELDKIAWILSNVSETRIIRGQITPVYTPEPYPSLIQRQHDTLVWQTRITPEMIDLMTREATYLSLSQLLDYARYLAVQGMDDRAHWLMFWDKVLQPFVCLGMVFVGMVFVLGPMRSVSITYRIFAGILVGISMRVLQEVTGQLGLVYLWSPFLSVVLPILAVYIVGLLMLRKR